MSATPEAPECPICLIPMQALNTIITSKGPYDQIDDPALDSQHGYECPQCERHYVRNNQDGALKEIPRDR